MANFASARNCSLEGCSFNSNEHFPSISQNSDGHFYDVSLSTSQPICRICHCSEEDEVLMQACRCSGSVGYAHQSCILKWIMGSGTTSCELCHYIFKTETRSIKNICKIKFPKPSFKGWLHIMLFFSLFLIMTTSLTWILWSRLSNSYEAKMERVSKESGYAYAVNAGFIAIAVIGLYVDSYRQCRSYITRWCFVNKEMVVLPYNGAQEVEFSHKTTAHLESSQINGSQILSSPRYYSINDCHNQSADLESNIRREMQISMSTSSMNVSSYYSASETSKIFKHSLSNEDDSPGNVLTLSVFVDKNSSNHSTPQTAKNVGENLDI